jgi:hypothetical protein
MTRINREKYAVVIILLCCWFSGCTQRVGDFTLVSTKNIDLSNAHLDVREGKRTQGEDCRFIVLFIPLGLPHVQQAVDDALAKGNGNVMVDQVTYRREWWFIVGQSCFVVEGTVLNVGLQ